MTYTYCAIKRHGMLGKLVHWIFLGPYSLYAVYDCLKTWIFLAEILTKILSMLLPYVLYLRKSEVQKPVHNFLK